MSKKSKTIYTVREPGCSYWWQGTSKKQAERELRKAKNAGLSKALVIAEK
jgi:hypothetical protein